MARHALFRGLIVDEYENPVETTMVGEEAFYVVNDDGFRRHVSSEDVDREVLGEMGRMLEGMEEQVSEQAAKMMGQDDIFTRAAIESQLQNMDAQFDKILETGLPESSLAYLGMAGFKIRINLHGEVLEVIQPGMIDPDSK
jgi:hypothetical protein